MKRMTTVKILDTCFDCGNCEVYCPTMAITFIDGKMGIDETLCIECLGCVDACPINAIQWDWKSKKSNV